MKRTSREALDTGVECERAGHIADALEAYRDVVAREGAGDQCLLAEALRRLAVVHHRQGDTEEAMALCRRSLATAEAAGDRVLTADALNTLAGFEFERGDVDSARARFEGALALAGDRPALRARVEQNLGILANIQGEHQTARRHYGESLAAFERADDVHGCAIAHHNLGMVSADRGDWGEAEAHYLRCLELAEASGDVHLRGLGLLNHGEVLLARGEHEAARLNAERALAIFNDLGAQLDKPDAYALIGRVYRATGRVPLAEARLRTAVELARKSSSVLSEAEVSRELALLLQAAGRNQEALSLLNRAHQLFSRMDARVDLIDVSGRMGRLEQTYFEVVREWGQSIESADSYTHGHCERVAGYALQVAEALALDEETRTAIRLGAYLHDVGKIRVPHEILNKPGPLTPEEFDVVKQHPRWGVELLAEVEFPWDLKPMIRWHHERRDGKGYPDQLAGARLPLTPQIIGIVDVFDALTTTRSYRPAMAPDVARSMVLEGRTAWREDVVDAFLATVHDTLRIA
ncbi:MAG: tetratricopeptide repeat protein [Gemmatimonadales bacterium]|nr:tetratricopeptide repeat protein [Gemmatimonadales bacterium]